LAEEAQALTRTIHDEQGFCADGGHPVRGVARLLPHANIVRLFQKFFARTNWED
jgi:hypothetical protein